MNTEFIMNNYIVESFSIGFIAGLTVAFIILCAIFFSKSNNNQINTQEV